VIGQTVAEIWRFFNFKDGGRPPSWLFENVRILTADRVERINIRRHAKFRGDRSNRCSNEAIFIFQHGGRRRVGFSKCGNFICPKGQKGQNTLPCQISG